jgi:hypothetical protein
MLLSVTGVARAGSEDEVKALFAKFVAAQNATTSKRLVSCCMTRLSSCGSPVVLLSGAARQLSSGSRALYQGTWSLEPNMDELKVTELQPGVVQLYVPIMFMISPAGQTAQPTRFLMNQLVVNTADGWKVSNILPIPAPQP